MNKYINEADHKIRPYRTLTSRDIDSWGSGLWEDAWINIYTDKRLINKLFTEPILETCSKGNQVVLADFGCGDGIVMKTINESLKKDYQANIYNIDKNPEGIEQMQKSQDLEIHPVLEDLLNLPKEPITKSYINHGTARFVIPYFSQEEQPELLNRFHQCLTPGGTMIILHDGPQHKEEGKLYNHFFNEINNVFRSKSNNYYPSVEELVDNSKKIGYKINIAKELTEIQAWLSPRSYDSRFKLTEHQFTELNRIFKRGLDKKQLPFTIDCGTYRIKRPLTYCIISKPK